MMKAKSGEPIKIANLPSPGYPAPPFLDHTQHKTIVLRHDGEDQSFEHSGTNGFTTNIVANSAEKH